jgi:hypothetical protein
MEFPENGLVVELLVVLRIPFEAGHSFQLRPSALREESRDLVLGDARFPKEVSAAALTASMSASRVRLAIVLL